MESIIFSNTAEIKKAKAELEKKLSIKIEITGKKVTISGEGINEYEASIVLDAINLGFSAKKALFLLDPEIQFRTLNIKEFTNRKILRDVRARVIGREGKTKRTIEELTDSTIIVKDNTIGIIGYANTIENTLTALRNLIRGSKEANVYRFLEEMNRFAKQMND
jgi:ribosomal RNA assembly protein